MFYNVENIRHVTNFTVTSGNEMMHEIRYICLNLLATLTLTPTTHSQKPQFRAVVEDRHE